MQSISEMIQNERQNSEGQLRAIAEGYETAFMDASSTLSDVNPVLEAFEDRVTSYDESQQEIEALCGHQKRIVGLYSLSAHPFSNIHLTRRDGEPVIVIGEMKRPSYERATGFRG